MGTGGVPDQGGFEPLCVSSLPAPKPGICELGRFLGKTVQTRTETGSFWYLGMPSTSHILDVFTSTFKSQVAYFCQLLYGQLQLEKSVLGGKAWTNRKILVCQNRKMRFSARSKASCLFFQLLYGQLRLEKSVLGGEAWTNRKILVYQNRKMRFSARSKASSLFF